MRTIAMYVKKRVAMSLALVGLTLFGFAAASAAQTTIHFWHIWSEGAEAMFESLAADFEAQNPDIDVNVVWVPQGAAQKERLLLNIAAGTPPDLMVAASPVSELALAGLLRPIDDLLQRSEHFLNANYAPGIFDLFKVDGVTYGVPAIEVGPMLGLAINVDLFREAGLAPDSIVTLEDLRQAHMLLTRSNGDVLTQLGFSPFDAVGGMYFPDAWAAAVYDHPVYDAESRTLRFNTPEMQELLEYLRSFFENVPFHMVQQFHGTYGWWRTGLASGRLAMHVNGYWQAGAVRPDLVDDEFVFTWMPNIRGDRAMLVGGWGLVIPHGAPNPEAAFRFAEYLTSDAAAQVIFNNRGWLNANLDTMSTLDVSLTPGLPFFFESMAVADRLLVPESIPIMSAVRASLGGAAQQVAQGAASPVQVLSDLEIRLQAQLDEFFSTVEGR